MMTIQSSGGLSKTWESKPIDPASPSNAPTEHSGSVTATDFVSSWPNILHVVCRQATSLAIFHRPKSNWSAPGRRIETPAEMARKIIRHPLTS